MHPNELPPNMAAKIAISDDGCWLWTGAATGAGYGSVSHERRIYNAHRLAYRLLVGEPADGLVLDHLCRNTLCVNPEHLDPVTQRENYLRSPLTQHNTTHCKRGHEWVKSNWYVKSNGRKQCYPCMRDLWLARYPNARAVTA